MTHGGMLALVADGMGGMAHGGEASRLAVRAFLRQYASKQLGESIPQALGRAVEAADRSVVEFAESVGLARDVGSTLVAAAFTPSGLYWMSVGDSALYLCRDGALTQLNHPHTLSARLAELVKRGDMSPEDAAIDPDRDALTSYVGAGPIAEIDSPGEGFVRKGRGHCHSMQRRALSRAQSRGNFTHRDRRRRPAGGRRRARRQHSRARTSPSG